jgi:hypothetical protein
MAKLKKTARTSARKTASGTAKDQAQADRLGKSITESAQQIWLAGMGAFNRAQAEGAKTVEAWSATACRWNGPRTIHRCPRGQCAMRSKAASARRDARHHRTSWKRCSRTACARLVSSACRAATINALTHRVERLTENTQGQRRRS